METQNQTNTPPNQTHNQPSGKDFLQSMEDFFDTYLHQKVPFHLPIGVKEFIVSYGPYITVVFAVLGLISVLGILNIGSSLNPYLRAFHANLGMGWYIAIGLSIVVSVMEIMAFAPLKNKQLRGWKLLYFSTLLMALGDLVSMNIFSLVLGLVVGMYFLFQVKSYYK